MARDAEFGGNDADDIESIWWRIFLNYFPLIAFVTLVAVLLAAYGLYHMISAISAG